MIQEHAETTSWACPCCGEHKVRVVDSRWSAVNNSFRRRRRCEGCGHRFTTYESEGRPEPSGGKYTIKQQLQRAVRILSRRVEKL